MSSRPERGGGISLQCEKRISWGEVACSLRKISSCIENEISMTNFAKMQKNMIFRIIFGKTYILTHEKGWGGSTKCENSVRWRGGGYTGRK